MSCNRPIPAWYSSELNESGKRSLVFNPRKRYLGSDLNYTSPINVGCGKCHGCKKQQSLAWSIRAYHESLDHEQNAFITLTYDDENLPADGKIDKTHLQKFIKRLRKSGKKIRYIACGEYGGKTKRPHYHAIIFGKDWLENKISITDELYTNQNLVDAWGMGMVSIAPVTMASICYVCGYVTKKLDDEDTFVLQSRRPGIGHNFLDQYKNSLVNVESVTIEGRAYPIPKRYILWEEDSGIFENIINKRKQYGIKNAKHDPMDRSYRERNRESNLKIAQRSKGEKI